MVMHVSTIVLGGGPAACAAAIRLARAGRDVVILERSRYEMQRVGESLPPGAKVHLDRLGAWDACAKDIHLPSPGIVSVWGSPRPYEKDFIFDSYGNGWHIDRRRFDESLADLAHISGVKVYSGTRLRSVSPSERDGWEVDAWTKTSKLRFRAEFLIDATGRACWLSRRLGSRPIRTDQLVGIVANFSLPPDWAKDRRTWLEARENGWWYSALLPCGRMALAYMTDTDLLPASPRDFDGFLDRQLECTSQTRSRLPPGVRGTSFRVVGASSYRMDRVVGQNWVAVGDAAMGWDPLSGQGITKALESGFLAASALLQASDGDRAALENYAAWIASQFEGYRGACAHHYRAESRWPESRFWQRRQRA